MKKIVIITSYMLLFMSLTFAQTGISTPNNQKGTPSGLTYTCSMHPEISSDKSGKCPKCDMDLIQKASVQYTCPMHPDVVSNGPGKCAKCKMALELKSSTLYSCPMHPEVTSKEPGKCPKCGMKLQKSKDENNKMKMGCCM